MQGERCQDRQVIRIGGADRLDFLQGLITNDVNRLQQGLVYAALLSPQGKYLADFFLVPAGDAVLLDVQREFALGLVQRLTMYRLRADVTIEPQDIPVWRGLGRPPEGGLADPRDPGLGWRHYGALQIGETDMGWAALRVAACVPETGIELIANGTYILEAGFERLNGVDFKKGCYVGQEVTARMKHKTELRKGLVPVAVEGAAPPGTAITAAGKPVGTLYTQSGGRGIAWLRFDRAAGEMTAGPATVQRV
ncbi:MAG: folate-binding protein YgfZ [Rhodobacteraceae bacterium]|nr:folate-binding protein YgfZ [Paracoccaceae bacterium]